MIEDLKIELLAKCKQHTSVLAQLWLDEVGKDSDPRPRTEHVIQRFIEHCNEEKLPLAYAAIYQNNPIGMICLRITEGILDNLTPWLGGLVVHPDYRRKKVGERLVSIVKEQARTLDYSELYLLSDDALSSWYKKLGWQKIGIADNDPGILIMAISL
ncbi:MAG: GNAT family N-acetyltransferase [Gammaproteobacteria bacterium]|nr:GNAT family N-acetyltransferase [Gammaproteobacteria bacterium]